MSRNTAPSGTGKVFLSKMTGNAPQGNTLHGKKPEPIRKFEPKRK